MSLPPSQFFPPADDAGPDGLIGFGGRLTPEWLLDAYSHGIFPWPTGNEDRLIPWCSPDPRAIIELDRFHIPRRLRTHVSGRKVPHEPGRKFCRRDRRVRRGGRSARRHVADPADDSRLHPAGPIGTRP